MTSKLLTLAVAAGSLGAAGTAGYLVAELREPTVAAVRSAGPDQLVEAVRPAESRPATDVRPPVDQPVPERRAAPAPRRPPATAPDRAPIPAASPAFTSTLPVSADTPPLAATVIDTLPLPAAPVTRIELTVEADSVIGVRIENPVSSATARVEDPVSAIVSRDVVVDGRTAIPAGSRIEGYVSFVERGGKFREKARISLLFTTLVLSPAERIPIVTEAIHRDGDSPTAEATTKIGAGAVVGGVLGAIIGGKKGAAIGGAAGAAGGTAAVAAGGQNDAVLAGGALLTLRLLEPVVIAVDREP